MVQIGQETKGALHKNKNEVFVASIRNKRESMNNDRIVMGKRQGSGKRKI